MILGVVIHVMLALMWSCYSYDVSFVVELSLM